MFRFAAQNLLSRPVRSLLALLGLTVAIMGMVGLFSIAVGIDDTLNRSFNRIPGLAAMQPGAPIPLFSRIPTSWAAEIATVKGVRIVRPEVWARAQLVDGKPTFSPPRLLFGTDIEPTLALKKAVYRDDIVAGRFLEMQDIGKMSCVISQSIADAFHKKVGDGLRVDTYDLTIVGIYKCDSLLLDVAIVMDSAAVRQIAKIEDKYITSVYFEQDGTVPDAELIESIQAKFRGRNVGASSGMNLLSSGDPVNSLVNAAATMFQAQSTPPAQKSESESDTPPPPEDALDIRSANDWGKKIQELSSDLDIFLYLMTGIGVVIALLSILNTMLMSVAERMIEFGVLKANGWSAWDILRLITWESALLGILGGASGCGLGWIAVQIGNWSLPDKLHLYASPALLLFSLGFSTVLGMLGGLYPAWWAVRMSPMDAIRRG
ncbi:MAG: ABC transporter permease [Planctomycetes bacterium]|nr:ABC transporter permease [Planctomycetota bacterium]